MPNRNLAESLLARAIGPTRARAVFGDLLELAATRGRLWYIATYLRTLIAFTWRTPAAFLIAFITFYVLYRSNVTWYFFGRGAPLMLRHPYIAATLFNVILQLWFLVPFAAVRYGVRDRFVQLAFAASLIASCACGCIAVAGLSVVLTVLTLLAIAALLVSARWRGALMALSATIAVGVVTVLNLGYLAHIYCWIYEHKPLNATSHYTFFDRGYAFPHTIFWIVTWSIALLNMLVLSLVSSRLHRYLLAPSSREAEIA